MSKLTAEEKAYYARHFSLTVIGEDGQKRLKSSKVVLVGVGGLGAISALYLAGAGVGNIVLIDGDIVEISNLHRQPLYKMSDVGLPKALVAARELRERNPHITIQEHSSRLNSSNAIDLLRGAELVIDGTDSFETKYLISDACEILKIPLLSASLGEYEGQLSLFNMPLPGEKLGPSYRCLYPSPPKESPNCENLGVLGTAPGVMGMLQANEAIKYLTGFNENLSEKLLILNLKSLTSTTLSISRSSLPKTKLLTQREYEMFCGKAEIVPKVSEDEVRLKLMRGDKITLLDIREPYEIDESSRKALRIPLRELKSRLSEVPKDHVVAVYCPGEVRNIVATRKLRDEFGFLNAYALVG